MTENLENSSKNEESPDKRERYYKLIGNAKIHPTLGWVLVSFFVGTMATTAVISGLSEEAKNVEAQETSQESFTVPASVPFNTEDLAFKEVAGFSKEIFDLQKQLQQTPKPPQRKSAVSTGTSTQMAAPSSEERATSRQRIIESMQLLAKERKKRMEALLEKDPRLAFAAFLPKQTIGKIPAEVQQYMEQPAVVESRLELTHIDNFEKREGKFLFYLKDRAKRLSFYPIGGTPGLISGTKVRVKGYKLGDNVVADVGANTEERTLEVIETPPPETIGDQKTLVVLVNFLDSASTNPFTPEEAKRLIFEGQFQRFMQEQSYGKVSWSGDVVGWYTVQRNGAPNGATQWPYFYGESYDQDGVYGYLKRQGVNLRNYSRLVIIADHPNIGSGHSGVGKWGIPVDGSEHPMSISWIGDAEYHTKSSWWGNMPFQWTVLDFLLAHELGHALGVMHANGWECGASVFYVNCQHFEYGNLFDTMGYGNFSLHYNALYKEALHWLDDGIFTITRSGTYTIAPLENPSGIRAAKIHPPAFSRAPFYLEARRAIGFDAKLAETGLERNQKGLFINWIPALPNWQFSFPRLLDLSPSSTEWRGDIDNATLNPRNLFPRIAREYLTFTDVGRGVKISNVRSNATTTTFSVAITQPRCQRGAPLINSYPGSFNVHPGDFIAFSVSIQSTDSPACRPMRFSTAGLVAPPQGWTRTLDASDPITIGPESDPIWRRVEVQVSAMATAGRYKVILKLPPGARKEVVVDVNPPIVSPITLTPAKNTIDPSEALIVNWSNSSGAGSSDWIGLAPKGYQWQSGDANRYPYAYTGAGTSGAVTLTPPDALAPGIYQLHYYPNDSRTATADGPEVTVSSGGGAIVSPNRNTASILEAIKAALDEIERKLGTLSR